MRVFCNHVAKVWYFIPLHFANATALIPLRSHSATNSSRFALGLLTRPAYLADADVCVIVRLLDEVAASRKDHAGMKRLFMEGLCELINAEFWTWASAAHSTGKQPALSLDEQLVPIVGAGAHLSTPPFADAQ